MTPPPDPPEPAGPVAGGSEEAPVLGPRFWIWVAVLFVVVAAAAAGAVVWFVAGDGSSETIEIIVPAGTQDRLDAGEKVVLMPTRLEFRVGDRIFIRNDDDVVQSVGPYVVGPGEELLLEYGAPGVYEGYCPLSEGERYEIVVTR